MLIYQQQAITTWPHITPTEELLGVPSLSNSAVVGSRGRGLTYYAVVLEQKDLWEYKTQASVLQRRKVHSSMAPSEIKDTFGFILATKSEPREAQKASFNPRESVFTLNPKKRLIQCLKAFQLEKNL